MCRQFTIAFQQMAHNWFNNKAHYVMIIGLNGMFNQSSDQRWSFPPERLFLTTWSVFSGEVSEKRDFD